MTVQGKLTLDQGVVSAKIGSIAHMDAAVVGEIAGFEIEAHEVNATIGANASYRAPLTLSVSLHPQKMRELALLLATKSGMPLFNEREWRDIADMLTKVQDDNSAVVERAEAYSMRIEEAGLKA